MKASWKKNRNLKPQIILDKIDSLKSVNDDKKVSYSGFQYHEAMAALVNMVDFTKKSDELNPYKILSHAVNKIAASEKLTERSVLDQINEIIKVELAVREYQYRFLTSVSVNDSFPIKSTNIEGCSVRLTGDQYPKKYIGRQDIVSSQISIIDNTPHNYKKLIVILKSKSIEGAASKALRIIDLFRAVSCLFANSSMEIIGEEWKPINKIRLGNIHTLHKENGKVISDDFWYEPNFTAASLCNLRNPEVFSQNFKWFLKQIEKIPYQKLIKDALLRYVRALDERDQNVALIKLWGALETLAAPSEANYDLITRRCAFLFDEPEYHKQILEHLREYRNQSIHAGDQAERAKTNCFQLQFYFYYLVLFHVRGAGNYTNIDEANNFLDLSTNIEVLRKQKNLLEAAIKYRKPDA